MTLPYPGFPTDLQPFAIALRRGRRAARAHDHREPVRGAGSCSSRSWPGSAPTSASTATTPWSAASTRLSGAPVEASDIRAGAALVLAGLVADGVTTVSGAHHVDRGYAGFDEALRGLGRGRHARGRTTHRTTGSETVVRSVPESLRVGRQPDRSAGRQ